MGTVSILSMVGMIFAFMVSVGLPTALFIIFFLKKKADYRCFAIGAVTFIIFALILESICHRIVLGIAGEDLIKNTAFLAIYGGLAAGLFEETGRLVAMKTVMKKLLTKENALMYGVGHGGIEAIIIVGLTSVSNFITSIMINMGAIESMLSGLDESMKTQTMGRLSLLTTTAPLDFYMAGVERISAIVLHIGLSYLVYLAVKNRKYGFYCLSVMIHAGVDAMTVALSKTIPVYGLEIALLLVVIAFIYFIHKAYQKEPALEVQVD